MLMLHAAVSLSQADRAASFRRDRSDSMEGASMTSTRCAPQTLLAALFSFFATEHGLAKHCTALERDGTTERQMSWLTDRRLL